MFRPFRMSASRSAFNFTTFKLGNHSTVVTSQIKQLQWSHTFADLKIVCQDGFLLCHRAVIGGVSPFLKNVLKENPETDEDQLSMLIVPEIKKSEMENLLALLYSGQSNLYKSEIQNFIQLTQLLKLKTFPVSVNDHKWTKRFPSQPVDQIVEHKSPNWKKVRKTRQPSEQVSIKSIPILSTKRTRSGRLVVAKKFDDEIIGDVCLDVDDVVAVSIAGNLIESSSNNEVSKTNEFQYNSEAVISRKQSKKVSKLNVAKSNVADSVVAIPNVVGENREMEGLLSVAKAFDRSQQPDFNDITNPVLDDCDTRKVLLRICVLCSKQVLGRNAYGRHMKNSHPKVFGPYTCPVSECGRRLESGVKVMQHMHSHLGPRAQALAQGQKFSCADCNAIYTTASRLNDHRKKKHGSRGVTSEAKFFCNAHQTSDGQAECNVEFSTAKLFSEHMSIVHSLKPWLCQICSKRFKERQNFQYHSMMHEGTKSFLCDICQKSFSNPRQLYSHRALHLGRRFLCAECGYRARSSANLRGHIKSKHESKQFECKFCLKKFGSGNNLRNHIRIHTGETPYDCELCGVKFKRIHHLHSHIETKLHSEVMDKLRKKGFDVPDQLDPAKRPRGREVIEDGPITCLTAEQLEEAQQLVGGKIVQVTNEPWSGELIVLADRSEMDAFVIPMEAGTVEIIQNDSNEEVQFTVELKPVQSHQN